LFFAGALGGFLDALYRIKRTGFFTHESNYCFQRVLAITILSVCLSVRPLHGWISQKRCKLDHQIFTSAAWKTQEP